MLNLRTNLPAQTATHSCRTALDLGMLPASHHQLSADQRQMTVLPLSDLQVWTRLKVICEKCSDPFGAERRIAACSLTEFVVAQQHNGALRETLATVARIMLAPRHRAAMYSEFSDERLSRSGDDLWSAHPQIMLRANFNQRIAIVWGLKRALVQGEFNEAFKEDLRGAFGAETTANAKVVAKIAFNPGGALGSDASVVDLLQGLRQAVAKLNPAAAARWNAGQEISLAAPFKALDFNFLGWADDAIQNLLEAMGVEAKAGHERLRLKPREPLR